MKTKRALSLAVSLLMLLSMTNGVAFAADSPLSADSPNSWAVPYVLRAVELEIIDSQDLPEGVLFREGAPRWYIAELLANYMVVYSGAADLDEVVSNWLAVPGNEPGDIDFPDVPDTHPQYAQIMAMATMGVVTGGEFGGVFGFGPNHTLTRAEAAVGLTRMMEALGYTVVGFPAATDFADWLPPGQGGIQSWARGAVAFMYYHEVMLSTATTGTPPGDPLFIFNPNFAFQTQQLIAGMVRMLDEVEWRDPPQCQCMMSQVHFDIFDLVPGGWVSEPSAPGADNSVIVEVDDDAYRLINVGGSWPHTTYTMETPIPLLAADWDDMVLRYNIRVAGAANILFAHGDATQDNLYSLSYILSERTIGTADDDLPAGWYSGEIPLRELLAYMRQGQQITPFAGELFSLAAMRVFAVNGTVTFYSFSIETVFECIGEGCTAGTPDPNRPPEIEWLWRGQYAGSGFAGSGFFPNGVNIVDYAYYHNRERVDTIPGPVGNNDVKYVFYSQTEARVVNVNDGWAITLPTHDYTADFRLSGIRSQFHYGAYDGADSVLTVTREDQSPYSNTREGWNIFFGEWINRFIGSDTFLSNNDIGTVRAQSTRVHILPGFEVVTYNLRVEGRGNIERPYYDIAVIRRTGEYRVHYMLVRRSAREDVIGFDRLIAGFAVFSRNGRAQNDQTPFEPNIPDYWSAETRAYYEKLLNQETVDWGFFTRSMAGDQQPNWSWGNIALDRYHLNRTQNFLAEHMGLDSRFDFPILPTYTHLRGTGTAANGWRGVHIGMPLTLAREFAGGNGFNGRPVLQISYQFTTTNNGSLDVARSPMFDILNGDYDDQFRFEAQQLIAYGYPVLFRLNNEMNTDWVSYCGMITLMDPDIFVKTWEHMYNIFREEGADNLIWIFNPHTPTIPFGSWGEWQAYLPSMDTVHMLGITYYEMGNHPEFRSFRSMYTTIYNKYIPYFDNFPWSISEFAAGSGGERQWRDGGWQPTTRFRHVAQQTAWVNAMFNDFRNRQNHRYLQNIRIAVWFSVNDVVGLGWGQNRHYYSVNQLDIATHETMPTIHAFRDWFAEQS
ncbi:MAG: glycoside hydrolase family 26 protein [Oscillospiraceae bacterium]|nr:glycoside hydrolase family 26 protein [Oscillospiraceae bacterium]